MSGETYYLFAAQERSEEYRLVRPTVLQRAGAMNATHIEDLFKCDREQVRWNKKLLGQLGYQVALVKAETLPLRLTGNEEVIDVDGLRLDRRARELHHIYERMSACRYT